MDAEEGPKCHTISEHISVEINRLEGAPCTDIFWKLWDRKRSEGDRIAVARARVNGTCRKKVATARFASADAEIDSIQDWRNVLQARKLKVA